LLGRNPDIQFDVLDSIPINDLGDKKELAQKLDSSNTSILAYKKQVDVSKLSLKEMNTLLLLRLTLMQAMDYFRAIFRKVIR